MIFFFRTKKTALDWSGVEAAIDFKGPWDDLSWLTVNGFLLSIFPKDRNKSLKDRAKVLKDSRFIRLVSRLSEEITQSSDQGVTTTLYLHKGLPVKKNHAQLQHLKCVVNSFVRVYTQGVMPSEDSALSYMELLYLNCLTIQQSLPIVRDSYCFVQAPDSDAIRLELYRLVDFSRYGQLVSDLESYRERTVKVYECGGRIDDDQRAAFEELVASLAPRKGASTGGGEGGGGGGDESPAAGGAGAGHGAGGEGGGQGASRLDSDTLARLAWGSQGDGSSAGTVPKEGGVAESDDSPRSVSGYGSMDLEGGGPSGSDNPPATAISQPLFAKKYAKNVMIVWMLGVPLMTVSGFVMVLQYLPATVSLYHLMLTACAAGLMVAAANGLVCSMFKVITKRMSWPRMIVGGMLALVSGAGLALALTGTMSASLMALPLLPAVWMACAAGVGAFSSLMGILPLETTPASAQGLQGAGAAAQRKPEEGVTLDAGKTLGAGPH